MSNDDQTDAILKASEKTGKTLPSPLLNISGIWLVMFIFLPDPFPVQVYRAVQKDPAWYWALQDHPCL